MTSTALILTSPLNDLRPVSTSAVDVHPTLSRLADTYLSVNVPALMMRCARHASGGITPGLHLLSLFCSCDRA